MRVLHKVVLVQEREGETCGSQKKSVSVAKKCKKRLMHDV